MFVPGTEGTAIDWTAVFAWSALFIALGVGAVVGAIAGFLVGFGVCATGTLRRNGANK